MGSSNIMTMFNSYVKLPEGKMRSAIAVKVCPFCICGKPNSQPNNEIIQKIDHNMDQNDRFIVVNHRPPWLHLCWQNDQTKPRSSKQSSAGNISNWCVYYISQEANPHLSACTNQNSEKWHTIIHNHTQLQLQILQWIWTLVKDSNMNEANKNRWQV